MNERRVCSFKGFGIEGIHICRCSPEGRKKCRQNYDKIKKQQYVDQKGQHSFKSKNK